MVLYAYYSTTRVVLSYSVSHSCTPCGIVTGSKSVAETFSSGHCSNESHPPNPATMSEAEITAQIGALGDQIKAAKAEKKPKEEWEPILNQMVSLKVRTTFLSCIVSARDRQIL